MPTQPSAYQKVMDGLTAPQREAALYEDGPLIVLAGPGTGKTRVITARVADIIERRGVDPERVAAVTFTNKAAGELRERLGGLVGQSTAARIHASTFHSLGLKIVRRFADLLGLPGDPEIIDSAQRNRLIRDIIREEGLYRGSLGTGIDAAMEHAHGVMNGLRNLGMDSARARAWLDEHGERPADPEMDQGEREAREALLDRFRQAVGVYGHFEARCLARGWVVFDDLILMPTRLLRENAQVASIVHHETRHLVVDEFQDVNRGQIEMIRALCPPSEHAQVCVVGDDDQSIYGFRGADDRAFAHFEEYWSSARTIELTTNFRSAGVIVDASNESIARSGVRFAPDKQAHAHRGEVEGSSLELISVDDHNRIGEAIASMLLTMSREGGEGFSFGKCAVIARSKAFLAQITQALVLEGIPVDTRERVSPTDDDGALDVLAWARVVADPDSAPDLRRILTRPPYRVDPVCLSAMLRRYSAIRSQSEHADPDGRGEGTGTLVGYLLEQSTGTMRDRVEAMSRLLTELSYTGSTQRAAPAIAEIIKRTGVIHRDLENGHERSRRISAVAALVQFARSRAERFEAPGDLAAMLSYLDDMDKNDQKLGEMPEDLVRDDRGDVLGGVGDRGAVAMLSAHASKGLEFDTVFIARVGQHGFTPSSKSENRFLPEGIEDRGSEKERVSDEERRVFFVALTRAERRAIMLAKIPKSASAANFALELRDSMGERLIERDVSDVVDPDRAGDAVSQLGAEFRAVSRVRDAFDQAERSARRDAAEAIDAHELGEIEHAEMMERLGGAGERAAVVHEVRRTGRMPGWASDERTKGYARQLLGVLESEGEDTPEQMIHPGLAPPLSLSFSRISSYLYCPRCYLAEQIYKLGVDDPAHRVLGTGVHEALERFYKEWNIADAEGGAHPGYARLRELAKGRFMHHWPRDRELDGDKLEQLDALLDVYWNSMHRDDAHLLEIERSIEMPYECDGVTHTLRAKIDRVDAHGAGWRVVDYKTGKPTKKLTEPSKTDMQMGIYKLALEHALGEAGPGSVCEYWCLQDGTVGSIGFDALNMKKINSSMEKAIRGMLGGHWERSPSCVRDRGNSSVCMVLEASGMDFPNDFSGDARVQSPKVEP